MAAKDKLIEELESVLVEYESKIKISEQRKQQLLDLVESLEAEVESSKVRENAL